MLLRSSLLAAAHEASPAGRFGSRQSTPCATGVVPSEPLAPPFQRYTSIVLTSPPFVNAETISRSPSLCAPVKVCEAPVVWQFTSSCRNQNATFASPVLVFRSSAKYRNSLPFAALYAVA